MENILKLEVLIIICGILIVECIEKKVYKIDTKPKVEKDCHLKALDQCLNKAYYFTHRLNQTDLVSNEKDFDNMCRAVIKVTNCMDRYFERCSFAGHKELYQMGKDQFYQSWRIMCSEGAVRENYVKHSFCIQKAVKESEEYKTVCINNLQKAFDKSTNSNNMMDMMNIGCCAFNEWNQCIDSLVYNNCGIDGRQAIQNLIEKASGGTVYKLCPKDYFNSESEICRDLLSDNESEVKNI